MGQTFVTAGDVLTNCPHTRFRQCLTNGGILQFSVLALRHPSRNPPRYPIIQDPQLTHNVGRYDKQIQSENHYRLDHLQIEPTRVPGITPLPYQTGRITVQIYSTLSGGSWK